MQPGGRAFEAYVSNLKRTSQSRQARLQMVQKAADGRQALVLNPYRFGVDQSSPIAPVGSAGTPELEGK